MFLRVFRSFFLRLGICALLNALIFKMEGYGGLVHSDFLYLQIHFFFRKCIQTQDITDHSLYDILLKNGVSAIFTAVPDSNT